MYKLLAKQKLKFIIRMVSKNKSAYLILVLGFPFLKFLLMMSYDIFQIDLTILLPYAILCFIFMNLFGTIPRMRISPEMMIWQIEKPVVWKIKCVVKSCILTLTVAAVIMLCFSMKGQNFRQFVVVMICNVLINIQTLLITNYKHRNISNVLVLIFILICFYTGCVWGAAIGMMLYGMYFVFDSKSDYGIVVTFYQQYNKMLYSFLDKDNEAVLQAEESLFSKVKKRYSPS